MLYYFEQKLKNKLFKCYKCIIMHMLMVYLFATQAAHDQGCRVSSFVSYSESFFSFFFKRLFFPNCIKIPSGDPFPYVDSFGSSLLCV